MADLSLNGQIPRIRIEIPESGRRFLRRRSSLNGQIPRIRIEIEGIPEYYVTEVMSQWADS